MIRYRCGILATALWIVLASCKPRQSSSDLSAGDADAYWLRKASEVLRKGKRPDPSEFEGKNQTEMLDYMMATDDFAAAVFGFILYYTANLDQYFHRLPPLTSVTPKDGIAYHPYMSFFQIFPTLYHSAREALLGRNFFAIYSAYDRPILFPGNENLDELLARSKAAIQETSDRAKQTVANMSTEELTLFVLDLINQSSQSPSYLGQGIAHLRTFVARETFSQMDPMFNPIFKRSRYLFEQILKPQIIQPALGPLSDLMNASGDALKANMTAQDVANALDRSVSILLGKFDDFATLLRHARPGSIVRVIDAAGLAGRSFSYHMFQNVVDGGLDTPLKNPVRFPPYTPVEHFLLRRPTTQINRNRKRAAYVLKQFFCDDLNPIELPAELDEHGDDEHASQPGCQSCHYKLDPIGGLFRYVDGDGRVVRMQERQGQMDRTSSMFEKLQEEKVPVMPYVSYWMFKNSADKSMRWNTGFVRSSTNPQENSYIQNDKEPLEDLLTLIKTSPEGRRCLTQRMAEYFIAPNIDS